MRHMKRAYKHKPRTYKHMAAKESNNKMISFLNIKNIKIFSIIAVCVIGIGFFLKLHLSKQTQLSNDIQVEPVVESIIETSSTFSETYTSETSLSSSETTEQTTTLETTSATTINTTEDQTTTTSTTTTTSASNYKPPTYINENIAPENIVYSSNGFTIDASNSDQGYIGVKQSESPKNIKVKVVKDEEVYYYDLKAKDSYEFLPLQMGSGTYQISFLEHSLGNRYTSAFTENLNASLSPEIIPFLYPNQYVNYNSGSYCVSKSMEICKDSKSELESLQIIYNYILKNLSFDYSRLANVSPDYIPDIDRVLKSGNATCFDYAATLTAMLRTQDIPAKLVIGTAQPRGVNHAWVKVYMQEEGLLTPNLHISKGWNIIDPTFANSGEDGIEEYISNSSNYNAQRVY